MPCDVVHQIFGPERQRSEMAFISSMVFSTQTLYVRKRSPCSWRGDRYIIGKWSSFRGHTIPLQSPSRQAMVPLVGKGTRVAPRALIGGGGFLGVGPSEVAVILLVGWLLLGPEKLFALARDTGKVLGELRRTANKAKEQFNEAVELDLMAAEMREKKQIEDSEGSENGTATVNTFGDLSEPEPLKTTELVSELNSPDSAVIEATNMEAKGEEEVSNAFLDQLRRVSDPSQKAPSEIPDLDIDEEEEVRRLEQQYLAAKQRLERRKLEEQDRPEQNGNKSFVRER